MNGSIEVYNKNYELLAVFKNDDDVSINSIIDPTISIMQNGESTFSFAINANSEKWKDIKYHENIFRVENREYTALNEGSYTYTKDENGILLVNVQLVETWYLLGKKYEQIYNVNPDIETPDEQTILILPRNSAVESDFPNDVIYINGKRFRDSDLPYPRGSAGYALYALLYDTEWKLATCDVIVNGFDAQKDYGSFNLETDMKTILENIQMVQSLWGGILVWDSLNKRLSLRDDEKFQPYNGYQIKTGKNLQSIQSIINNDVYTKIYPLGETNLNIKAVNNGKSYLENYTATDKVYEKIIQNSNIASQTQLKLWGERKLKELSRPSKEITVKLYDLRETKGYEHEIFELNDIVEIVDEDLSMGLAGEFEKQRVIGWTYNVFYRSDSTVTLGNRLKNIVEIIDNSDEISGIVDGLVNGKLEYVGDKIKSLAEFKKEANDRYATIEALTSFQKETENGFSKAEANMKLLSDADKALAELTTRYQLETKNEFGKVRSEAQAYVNALSDADKAQVQLMTTYKKETDTAIGNLRTETEASITAVSSELSSQVTILTKYTDNSVYNAKSSLNKNIDNVKSDLLAEDDKIKSSMASIETKADKNGASITQIVEAVGTSGRVTAASIVASVNSTGSSVKISADKVEIDNLYPYRIVSYYDDYDYIMVGQSGGLADLRFYADGSLLFHVADNNDGTYSMQKGYSTWLYTSGARTYPQGTWDFSECSIRNLDTTATFG